MSTAAAATRPEEAQCSDCGEPLGTAPVCSGCVDSSYDSGHTEGAAGARAEFTNDVREWAQRKHLIGQMDRATVEAFEDFAREYEGA